MGGVPRPTLETIGKVCQCNEGKRGGVRGGPAAVTFLLREGSEGGARSRAGRWVQRGGSSRLHILGRGLFRRDGDGLLVGWQQNLEKDKHEMCRAQKYWFITLRLIKQWRGRGLFPHCSVPA